MRLWPRPRKRTSGGYTDELVRAIQARAGGKTSTDPTGLAVVQAAAGMLGRVLGAAEVTPATIRTAPLTAQWLRTAGRHLALHGEVVYRIGVDDGMLRLDQAASWEVAGRRAWRYRLTLPVPDGTITTGLLAADQVVHLRYHSAPSAPWRGLSPADAADTTATLAGALESMLSGEATGPSGYLIPDEADGQGPDLARLKGGTATVPTQQQWRGAQAQAPRRDWQAVRFGFAPPVTLRDLRFDLQQSLAAAYGVPLPLLIERSGGGSDRRAAWGEYIASEAQAVADAMAAELADKLEVPGLRLDLARLIPREGVAQARMVRQLVDAGMELEQARQVAGL